MPRDEPVGSFGRLTFKPAEFRDKAGLIGRRLLHDLPPYFDDSGSDSLPSCAQHIGARERIESSDLVKRLAQPLLPMARLKV